MGKNPIIVFVCEHGAAKSILAAAYFNKLAGDNNLGLTALARGTQPDAELSSKTVSGLREDGLSATESIPTLLTQREMESALRVISFCTLPDEYRQKATIEYWDGVPPISEDYEKARDTIVAHLKELVKKL